MVDALKQHLLVFFKRKSSNARNIILPIGNNDEVEHLTAKTGETISPPDLLMHDCYLPLPDNPEHIILQNVNQLDHPINARDVSAVTEGKSK